MRPNVFIEARDLGKLVYRWEGHNTWTVNGREYLAQVLTYASYTPDVPLINSHLKHIQFGIGGELASLGAMPGDVATAYPAGDDPNATAGNEYVHTYNLSPLISTLERPVRISGGTNPYSTAAPTDVWLSSTAPPKFLITQPLPGVVSMRFFISGPTGDIVYSPFTTVPLSEAGLVVSGQADPNVPYNPVVSYVNFGTLQVTATMEIEMEWLVSF